jgi:hypothetical protein
MEISMRFVGVVGAIALLLSGGVGLDAAAGATTLTATVRVVVRPVTSTGHVSAGFTLKTEPAGSVDCSSKQPSPGAVDFNIEFCSPSAEYAIACWNAAVAHRVLCVSRPAHQGRYPYPTDRRVCEHVGGSRRLPGAAADEVGGR